MAAEEYVIDVVTREAFDIVGLSVRTSMERSGYDCPRLWSETFGPRMEEVPTFAGQAFGVSMMLDQSRFDYWAGLLHLPGQPVPEGMAVLEVPGGLYAGCHLDGLPGLATAYSYFYHVWQPGSGFEFVLDAPCYELYPANHMQTGRLSLYMPVRPVAADQGRRLGDN